MGKSFEQGEGDYYYSKREWADKATKATRRKGFKATIYSISHGRWEVRVRQK